MRDVMITRRSIFAERLAEFPDFAFDGSRAFEQRGRWREIFAKRIGPGFDGRVIFDVGCADGQTLCEIASKFPHAAFVGLDWKYKSLYFAAARAAELALKNVMFLRARAQDVAKIFSAGELDEVWLFQPEPCDRPVELKNRLIAEPFLIDLHGVLRAPVAAVCIKTDHSEYYHWTLGLVGLQKILERFDIAVNSLNFWNDRAAQTATAGKCFAGSATPYERRFIAKRRPIYYLQLIRK